MSDFLEEIKVEGLQEMEDPNMIGMIDKKDPYIICDLLEKTKGGIYLKRLEDAIIETGDIVQIYEFLFLAVDKHIEGFDRQRFEEIIRNSSNPKLMCYCIGFVPGTDIRKMVEALIDTQNAKYMEMLLTNEEYKTALEEIKKSFPNYEDEVGRAKLFNYYPESLKIFGKYGDDINLIQSKIIKTQNPYLITELANYMEYLNEYKDGNYSLDDLISAQTQLKDPMECYEFLASATLKEEERSGLIEAVINSKRVKFMNYVLEYVPELTDGEKEKLERALHENMKQK